VDKPCRDSGQGQQIGVTAELRMRARRARGPRGVEQRRVVRGIEVSHARRNIEERSLRPNRQHLGPRTAFLRNFGDQLDLEACTERELCNANRAASMSPTKAKHLVEQLGCAVRDEVWLRECRRAVHQHEELDDAGDRVQVGGGGMQRAEELDGDAARSLLSLRGADLRAELADPRLSVLSGNMPGHEDHVPSAHERNEHRG
jgi:hypothetical protein